MSKIGIVVADGSRARFLTLAFGPEPLPPAEMELMERGDLLNSEAVAPATEWFPDSGSTPGAQRCRHDFLQRFAQRIIEKTRLFIADPSLEQLIFVAEPHLLGVARLELEKEPFRRVRVSQLAADLSRHSSLEIREILIGRGLLPATFSRQTVLPVPHGVSSCPVSESSSQMAPAPVSSPFNHRTS